MTTRLILLLLCTAACAPVGHDYRQPEVTMAATFAEASAQPVGEVAARRWWTAYQDKALTDLVERGLRQNLTIATALERIRAAEAGLRASGVTATALSGDLAGASTRSGGSGIATAQAQSASLSGSATLDLFGGLRRGAEAAAADLSAARADAGTARLAYLTAIVGAYIDARYYQESIALTRQTIATREDTGALTRAKVEAGTATEYDGAQVQALLDAARAELPGLEAGFLTQVYAIATLLGEPADPLLAQMQAGRAQPRARDRLAIGIPAELLRNRPDIRSAEQALVAATANAGVAEAALLPSITLSGALSASGTDSWSFGPQIALPALAQPRLRASRDKALSAARQAELDWRATILAAVEDVQVAHSGWRRSVTAADLRRRSVDSYARALDLSRQAFDGGALSLSDVLDNDRALATARLSLASATRDMAVNWAGVQVALGAGAYAE